MNILLKKLKSKKGSTYIENAVVLLVCLILLVMLIAFVPVFLEGREVGRIADELAQRIAWTGNATSPIISTELGLISKHGDEYTVEISDQNGAVINRQLSIEEFFTVRVNKKVRVNAFIPTEFSVFGRATGRAYVYSKN